MKKRKAFVDSHRPFYRRVVGPLACVLVLFYLGFHAISGERGVVALFKETRKLAQIKSDMETVVAKRAALEAKVKLLSSASLDLDLLDERARLILGLAGKNEVVYFLTP